MGFGWIKWEFYMKTSFKDKFANWIVCWAQLIDSIIGILTFGRFNSEIYFRACKWYLDSDFNK